MVTIESVTEETSGANEITNHAVDLRSWSSMNVHSTRPLDRGKMFWLTQTNFSANW